MASFSQSQCVTQLCLLQPDFFSIPSEHLEIPVWNYRNCRSKHLQFRRHFSRNIVEFYCQSWGQSLNSGVRYPNTFLKCSSVLCLLCLVGSLVCFCFLWTGLWIIFFSNLQNFYFIFITVLVIVQW